MTLIDRIEAAMASDDEPRGKQSDYLKAAYEAGGEKVRAALDEAFAALCGYTLETLIEQDSRG